MIRLLKMLEISRKERGSKSNFREIFVHTGFKDVTSNIARYEKEEKRISNHNNYDIDYQGMFTYKHI